MTIAKDAQSSALNRGRKLRRRLALITDKQQLGYDGLVIAGALTGSVSHVLS
jgi:hypothetical protein